MYSHFSHETSANAFKSNQRIFVHILWVSCTNYRSYYLNTPLNVIRKSETSALAAFALKPTSCKPSCSANLLHFIQSIRVRPCKSLQTHQPTVNNFQISSQHLSTSVSVPYSKPSYYTAAASSGPKCITWQHNMTFWSPDKTKELQWDELKLAIATFWGTISLQCSNWRRGSIITMAMCSCGCVSGSSFSCIWRRIQYKWGGWSLLSTAPTLLVSKKWIHRKERMETWVFQLNNYGVNANVRDIFCKSLMVIPEAVYYLGIFFLHQGNIRIM